MKTEHEILMFTSRADDVTHSFTLHAAHTGFTLDALPLFGALDEILALQFTTITFLMF